MAEFIAAIVEAIISLFVAGGEALVAGEILLLIFSFLLELVFWLILFAGELLSALFHWRKPRAVRKPVIWRPRKTGRNAEGDPAE